jgi:3-methyladenine DNA glycosylase AlkD
MNVPSVSKHIAVLRQLKSLSNPENVAGMARFGINPKNTYGIPIPVLRRIARTLGSDHELALQLWKSEIHEARILAALIDVPERVRSQQMELWVKDFDSWDVCDQCCSNLFYMTVHATRKAVEWSSREEEFVKRAGFTLMAALAVHDKKATDRKFIKFLKIIERQSDDERNYVKKSVNWALRQIGKRNIRLNKAAITTANQIRRRNSKASHWIAADALRELLGPKVQKRLRSKMNSRNATTHLR